VTLVEERAPADPAAEAAPDLAEAAPGPAGSGPGGRPGPGQRPDPADRPEVRLGSALAAAVLSGLAPAWLVARLFRGGLEPYAATVAGVLVGAGLTYLSFKTRRPAALQCLVPVVAAVVGALFALPATSGSASLPYLVSQALHAGGLRQAPVPFQAGWAFLCVLLTALPVAAALAVAVQMRRPRLLAAVPLPLTIGAALLQPKGAELASSSVAMALSVGGLLLSYGAVLAADGPVGARFEARRLARGGGLMAAVILALVGLAQTSFLFPASNRSDVIPPRKPPPPVALPNRVLFTVRSTQVGPWRVGTLDGYGQDAFLLPPGDPNRAKPVPSSGRLPGAPAGPGADYTATFEMSALPGRTVPTPAGSVAVSGAHAHLDYDPRTDDLELSDTGIPPDFRYTVTAALPPTGKQLATAVPADPLVLKEFGAAPPAPPVVEAALAAIPRGTDQFDRLQALRQDLYSKVVLAGTGKPVDIPPQRVAQMLAGGPASPYEVVAAQVLLARWAGIPARVGYGFYGGERHGDVTEFRPQDGAAWLEAWFQGYGWVPIVGTPPRAQPSISNHLKNSNPRVLATDQLAISVYVPIQVPSLRLLFQVVRWWVLFLLPFVCAAALILWSYPAALKVLRARRRRRWALRRGPPARIAVAYAELRDAASDLNIGGTDDTPLQFLDRVAPDDEHTELAWLVTRCLWGDLTRDIRPDDVVAAEEMSASVRRRLARGQTGLNRILAATARVSLRQPWSTETPNLWWRPKRPPSPTSAALTPLRGLAGASRRLRVIAAAVAGTLGLGACAAPAPRPPAATVSLPARLVPATVGAYRLVEAPTLDVYYHRAGADSLVTGGRVFEVRDSEEIQGTVQVALFKPGIDSQLRSIQDQVESGLGAAVAVTRHFGLVRLRVLYVPEQQIFLWFPPDHNVMELFIMRSGFNEALPLVESVIGYQIGASLPGALP
jgi:hypothetical protein